jgi:serine/threonine protein kinase
MENYELCNPLDRKNILGVGSFATVKLARDKRNNNLVALKIVFLTLAVIDNVI